MDVCPIAVAAPGSIRCKPYWLPWGTAGRAQGSSLLTFPSSQKEVGVIVSEAVCVDAAVARLQE